MKSLFRKTIISIITWQATYILHKFNPKIVAITGSVGKTSTKDAIYTALKDTYRTRKSEKSFNSEFGVPLTIMNRESGWSNPWLWFKNIMAGFKVMYFTKEYPQWLVLEVGADHPGDIARVTSWVRPNISVVTALAKVPVHVEYFSSPQAVWKEKSHLVKAVAPRGQVVLNADDENVRNFASLTHEKMITFGIQTAADITATHIETVHGKKGFPTGVSMRINCGGNSIPLTVHNALGNQHVYPLIAALAVAKCAGVSALRATHALESHETAPGRMKLIPGIKETLIIDDTYNSSPIALREALVTLESIKTDHKKIAILGDMLELGTYSADEHKKAGTFAASVVDYLIAVGPRSRHIVEGALNNEMDEKNIFHFEDSREAGKFAETLLKKGDVVLIKGSQGMRMEKAVLELMAEPQKAEKLLARQTGGWENK